MNDIVLALFCGLDRDSFVFKKSISSLFYKQLSTCHFLYGTFIIGTYLDENHVKFCFIDPKKLCPDFVSEEQEIVTEFLHNKVWTSSMNYESISILECNMLRNQIRI